VSTEAVSKRDKCAAATTVLMIDVLEESGSVTLASREKGIQALMATTSGAIPRICIARFML